MRIAIVNACSPDMPHVCAVRARSFAEALSRRGEDVLLLTPPPYETGAGTPLEDIPGIRASSDAGDPRHIALPHRAGSMLPAVRTGGMAPFRRRIRIASEFAIRGHVYGDWIDGGSDALKLIASEYRPDIVWAVFGNMGCWAMGRALAKQSNCPWVGDVKDSWERFIPPGFRKLTAWRFSDAAALTALSAEHAAQTGRFTQREATVIRSGLEQNGSSGRSGGSDRPQPARMIVLSGSLYDPRRVREFVSSLCRWQSARESSDPVRLVYAGGDSDLLNEALPAATDLPIDIDLKGTLAPDELMSLQASAWANAYIANAPNLFHHKLLELLVRNRPVIAYPNETRESEEIASDLGARLSICQGDTDLRTAFDRFLGVDQPLSYDLNPIALKQLSIETQATRLLSVFQKAIDGSQQ